MPDNKKMILILGAHRSGTSLCAAAIECLGAELCVVDQYANEENSKGFFEHPDIVDFNDRLLAHLGGSWDNPLFVGDDALAHTSIASWETEATELLLNIFAEVSVAAIKDPRICQLLGFWMPVFAKAGYAESDIHLVHTLRDPAHVAQSQQTRAQANPDFYEIGREYAEGAALWLSLTAQAVAGPGAASYFVLYEELVVKPESTLAALARFLGLSPDADRTADFCTRFVDPALHRSGSESAAAALEAEFPQVLEFYRVLSPAADAGALTGPIVASALDVYRRADTQSALIKLVAPALSRLSVRSRQDRLKSVLNQEIAEDLKTQTLELAENAERMGVEHAAVLEPLRGELGSLQSGVSELQSQLGAQSAELEKVSVEHQVVVNELQERAGKFEAQGLRLEAERSFLEIQRDELRAHVQAVEASLSWRITRPLRSLSFRFRVFSNWMASQWVQFRLKAILIYHKLSLRHPALAWNIRRLLRPVFRAINVVVGVKRPPVSAPVGDGGVLVPMLYQQHESSDAYQPLVSIIVPNYNHAAYLSLRLESIFSQTYQNFEVILLDDASSDSSADVLREFHQRYPAKSTLLINEANSGGVFYQWEKGLNLAKGEIIWIAESDDWCTDNFLETLVPYFENEAIQLAYSRTVFMDGPGDREIWSINEYLHDIDPQRWNHPIVETGAAIVRDAFAVKNIIPNVSSALMRAPQALEVLSDPQWREMRTCGDWVLYLHLLRGGMLAYSPLACNYYRIHGENTSVSSYSTDQFYREHELVAQTVQRYFDVPESVFERLRDNLIVHWRETRPDFTQEAFDEAFSLARAQVVEAERAPNLLMASYAFCAGGGETFPVSLANIMKRSGYNVTYLDCAREPRLDGVRGKLRADIPVVSDFSQLERIVADFEIDIVHSHHAWVDSTILDLLPEDTRCKTVVTLHGMYETINEYELRPILPRLVRRSAKLIYVADKNLTAIREHKLLPHASVARIDNALEWESFNPVLRADLGIAENAFVLTLVSRGMVQKGWQEGIDAVTTAREHSGVDIHLILVGDGPEYDRLLATDVAEFIHLEGFQRNVRGYFFAADVGFLPSKFRGESAPLVLIECLQAGRPVLASTLGEIPYMLATESGSCGVLVELQGEELNVDAITQQIIKLATDTPFLQLLIDSVPEAVAKFDTQILADKHNAVYRATLECAQ